MQTDTITIAVVVPRWGTANGGVNTFNTEFCTALAERLGQRCRLVCIQTDGVATLADSPAANITLARLPAREHEEKNDDYWERALRALFANRELPDWWVGHDVISGPQALALRQKARGRSTRNSRFALFRHMDYASYQTQKSRDANRTRDNSERQKKLMLAADAVFGVGPKLYDAAARSGLSAEQAGRIHELVPGLGSLAPRHKSDQTFKIIIFGRLDPEDDRIKQGRLALAAAVEAADRIRDEGLFYDVRITMVGLANDEAGYREEFEALHSAAQKRSKRWVNLELQSYTENRMALLDQLGASHACLMPSLHDGFGLTAWEAIAAEAPLVLSTNTGVYRLLQTRNLLQYVLPLGLLAPSDEAHSEQDIQAIVDHLMEIAHRPEARHDLSKILHQKLREADYSWRAAAIGFCRACNIPLDDDSRNTATIGDRLLFALQRNPYRYLQPYEIGDTLPGRDMSATELTQRIRDSLEKTDDSRFFRLIGPSGCGKSSLMRAGVLATLQNDGCAVLAMTPSRWDASRSSRQGLITGLLADLETIGIGISIRTLHQIQLVEDKAQGAALATAIANKIALDNRYRGLVFGIDQFEESVFAAQRPPSFSLLIDFIAAACIAPRIAVLMPIESENILSIRTPELARLAESAWQHREIKRDISLHQLREIVRIPFENSGFSLREEAINLICKGIHNVVREDGHDARIDSLLPLISHMLSFGYEELRHRDDLQKIVCAPRITGFPKSITDDTSELRQAVNSLFSMAKSIEKNILKSKDSDSIISSIGELLRPMIHFIGPSAADFQPRIIALHPYDNDRRILLELHRIKLVICKGSQIRLAHKAVVTHWSKAKRWVDDNLASLDAERRIRRAADQWNGDSANITEEMTSSDADDAAVILNEQRRYWPLLDHQQIAEEDRRLIRYSLAVLKRYDEPLRIVKNNLIEKTHAHIAANYGDIDLLESFRQTDPTCLHAVSNTNVNLIQASAWSSRACTQYLIDHGVDPCLKDNEGWPPIAAALRTGNRAIFELLIPHYCRDSLCGWAHGYNALHALCTSDAREDNADDRRWIGRCLLEQFDLDPNAQDAFGCTALHRAATMQDNVVLELLIHRGDPDIRDNEGLTVLHTAARHGIAMNLRTLLGSSKLSSKSRDALVEPSVADKHYNSMEGMHALHFGVESQKPDCVALVLEYCQRRDTVTIKSRETALHVAAKFMIATSSPEADMAASAIFNMLLQAGDIDISAKNAWEEDVEALLSSDWPALRTLYRHHPALICENFNWQAPLSDAMQMTLSLLSAYHGDPTAKDDAWLNASSASQHPVIRGLLRHDEAIEARRALRSLASEAGRLLRAAAEQGRTLWHLAMLAGDTEALAWLLRYPQDAAWRIEDVDGYRPIDLASPILHQQMDANAMALFCTWSPLALSTQEGILGEVRKLGADIAIDTECRIEYSQLPFYSPERVDLLQITPSTVLDLEDMDAFVQEPLRYLRLKGSTESDEDRLFPLVPQPHRFHEINVLCPPRLDTTSALHYLQFFCRFVRAAQGPFFVLRDAQDPSLPPNLKPDYRQLILDKVKAPIVTRHENDFMITAAVVYGEGLFDAVFRIKPDGQVLMESDQEITSRLLRSPWRSLEETNAPSKEPS
jgi:ankyrin repeat protein